MKHVVLFDIDGTLLSTGGAGQRAMERALQTAFGVEQCLHDILAACDRNRVQFMDGVMFNHNPRLDHLQTVLGDPERIGPIRRITSVFNFLGTGDFRETNVRAQNNLEPLGCLGDLGWYCIRFSLWAMGWKLPLEATGRILAGGKDCAPLDFSGELFFADGVSAAFHCSFLAQGQQWAVVSGAQGTIRVPDFVLPISENEAAWEINYQPVPKAGLDLYLATPTTARSQEAVMFRNFARQVRTGSLNPQWPEMALKTQRVTDACMASARAAGSLMKVD